MAIASATEFSNAVNQTEFIAADIAAYLRANVVVLPRLSVVDKYRKGSDTIKLRQKGSLTATVATEATDHALSEYTQTSIGTMVVQQVKVLTYFSKKGQRFSNVDVSELTQEQAMAIGQKVETDITGLFDGFATTVGSTGVAFSISAAKEAMLKFEQNNPTGPGEFILHPAQVADLTDAIVASSGSVWANTSMPIGILNGQIPQVNGLKGEFLGAPVFATTNTEDKNSGTDWAGFYGNPRKAIAFADDTVGIEVNIDYDNISSGWYIETDLFYQVREYVDLEAVYILSAQ